MYLLINNNNWFSTLDTVQQHTYDLKLLNLQNIL